MNDSPGIGFVKRMVASYLVDCATDGYVAALKEFVSDGCAASIDHDDVLPVPSFDVRVTFFRR